MSDWVSGQQRVCYIFFFSYIFKFYSSTCTGYITVDLFIYLSIIFITPHKIFILFVAGIHKLGEFAPQQKRARDKKYSN